MDRLLPNKDKAIPFIIFSSFLATYLVMRIFIYLFPKIFLNLRGTHVHHFAYGLIVITLVGAYDLIVRPKGKALNYVAIIFGIAMAFSYDEFGMWLRLRDNDVARYGFDAIITISLVFLNIIYFHGFWDRMGAKFYKRVKKQVKI